MKYLLIFTLFILVSIRLWAQPINRNYSFENWNLFNAKLYPVGWIADTVDIEKGYVKRVSDGTNGSYAIFLGSTRSESSGAKISKIDSFSNAEGSLLFDFKITGFSTFIANMTAELSFYDSANFLIKKFINDYAQDDWEYQTGQFNFSLKVRPKYYRLNFSLYSYYANSSKAVTIDNIRFKSLTENINGIIKPEIKVYPNPTKNMIFVDGLSGEVIETVKLIAIDGKISSLKCENSSINLSGLNKGIYIIEFYNKQNLLFYKEKIDLLE